MIRYSQIKDLFIFSINVYAATGNEDVVTVYQKVYERNLIATFM